MNGINLHKKDRVFSFQIAELRQYINHLDEKIAMYKKQGRNTDRLQDNKASALTTIQTLKQAQNNNTKPLTVIR